ncbi:MAG: ribosome-associated translation inhibitor RaiA [Christensenellaceae bacterium]|jgi:putative sigma-54 modulation protein|nr:ribosome-associated translation inhibitor RaiA [Christensenellaceae bacterium]
MRFELISKNYKDSNFESVMGKKIAKLDKFFGDDVYAKVKLTAVGGAYTTEITIHGAASKTPLRAEITTHDMYNNIDLLISKIEKQVRKFRTREEIKKHGTVSNKTFDVGGKPVSSSEEIQNSKYGTVVRQKNFEISRISVDDAIADMELLDHSFYLFINSADGKVTLLYKRHDADYGLITPVY